MRLNGKELTPTPDTEDPYSHGYSPDTALSMNDHDCTPGYRAWTVPAELLVEGENRFEITMTEGEPAELFYLDVAME